MRTSIAAGITALALLGRLGGIMHAWGAEAKKVETASVSFQGGNGQIKGFLAKPEGAGPFPAIVVVHEWWGLSDWVKENTGRLAGEGYVALAVDLYGGKATQDPGEAHELMRALDPSEGLADLKGGIAYLQSQPFVDKGKKIGAVGWCMGGMYSRLIAQDSAAIGPTVICYGSVATEPGQIAKLVGKPVLGIFGATDRGIPADKVKQFEAALKASGDKDVTIRLFEDAGHAFMRPGGPQYHEASAKQAWMLIDRFFADHLRP